MTVTSNDIRALLDSDLDDAHLILEQGTVKVVSVAEAEDFRAGLTIASAHEIRTANSLDSTPDEDRLAAIAATYDQQTSELGG